MWSAKDKMMKDVIMPGIGLYRIQAARTDEFAGISEPEFGPDITETLGGVTVTYPKWCKVTVKRALKCGIVAEFTALEFWLENYAVKGGQDKSIAPNAMWFKRKYGQLAKCTSAQALRIAFPECGAQPTFEEMEGKMIEKEINPILEQTASVLSKLAKPKEHDALDKVLSAIALMNSKEVQDKIKIKIDDLNDEEQAKAKSAYRKRVKELRDALTKHDMQADLDAITNFEELAVLTNAMTDDTYQANLDKIQAVEARLDEAKKQNA
jgi:phage recombination protein Bet